MIGRRRCQPTRSSGLLVFETQPEHRLEVVSGELLESDHRLSPLDTLELGQPLGHDLGKLVVLSHSRDRDEIPLARKCVNLGDALNVRQARAEAGQAPTRRLDQDEGGEHKTILGSDKLSSSGT